MLAVFVEPFLFDVGVAACCQVYEPGEDLVMNGVKFLQLSLVIPVDFVAGCGEFVEQSCDRGCPGWRPAVGPG